MPFFRFHFFDGQSPKQIWAPTRQDAESVMRQQYGANFSFAGSGEDQVAGYVNISTGSQPQTARPQTAQPKQGFTVPPAPAGEFAAEDAPFGRAGAFRRALQQRGIDTGTLAGGSVLGQQGQFEDVFDALQALGRTGGGEQAFEQFATTDLSPFSTGRSAFGELAGLGGGADLNDRVRGFTNPQTSGQFGSGVRLALAALRDQIGAFGANPALQGLGGQLPEEFAAQSLSQQQAQPFLQYARQRLGLY